MDYLIFAAQTLPAFITTNAPSTSTTSTSKFNTHFTLDPSIYPNIYKKEKTLARKKQTPTKTSKMSFHATSPPQHSITKQQSSNIVAHTSTTNTVTSPSQTYITTQQPSNNVLTSPPHQTSNTSTSDAHGSIATQQSSTTTTTLSFQQSQQHLNTVSPPESLQTSNTSAHDSITAAQQSSTNSNTLTSQQSSMDAQQLLKTVSTPQAQESVNVDSNSQTLQQSTTTHQSLDVPSDKALKPGHKPSTETKLRQNIIDPWIKNYHRLQNKAKLNEQLYLPEDYVVQTAKYYFVPCDSQVYVQLHDIFNVGLKQQTPNSEQYQWIRKMKNFFKEATLNITKPEYATDIERAIWKKPEHATDMERQKSNENVNMTISDLPRFNKRPRSESDNDDEDVDNSKTLGNDDVDDDELFHVSTKLSESLNKLKEENNSYSIVDFWGDIGVKIKVNESDYTRANRLLKQEFQPAVKDFYNQHKKLIIDYLNRKHVNVKRRKIEDNNANNETKPDNNLSLIDEFVDQMRNFQSRVTESRQNLAQKQKDLEQDMALFELVKMRIELKTSELTHTRQKHEALESKFLKIKTVVDEVMNSSEC